jgi:oligoribonuclease
VARRINGDVLAWIDLEMTGLDVERDVIVEIACIVTDSNLEALDDGIQLVVRADADELARMSDFVREMHRKSGLLPEIEKSSTDVAAAQQAAAASQYYATLTQDETVVTVDSLPRDTPPRLRLDRYMPRSTIPHYGASTSRRSKSSRRWYPAEHQRGRPSTTALDDIRESCARSSASTATTSSSPRPTGTPA